MEGVSSEKQEFRIRDSGRCILGAGGSDKKTGPLSVESPRIKDLIKIANASINKFFFWSHSQGYIFFLSQGLGCTNVGIPFLLCKYLFVYFWNNRILLSELLEKAGMSTVIVVTWWGRDGIWAWVLQWIYFFIIYICQYSELILLLTEILFLYRLIYILTEYFDMKKE